MDLFLSNAGKLRIVQSHTPTHPPFYTLLPPPPPPYNHRSRSRTETSHPSPILPNTNSSTPIPFRILKRPLPLPHITTPKPFTNPYLSLPSMETPILPV